MVSWHQTEAMQHWRSSASGNDPHPTPLPPSSLAGITSPQRCGNSQEKSALLPERLQTLIKHLLIPRCNTVRLHRFMFANTQQGFNNCFKADPSKPSYERATTPSASPQFIQLPHASISTLWCHQICLKTTLNVPIKLLISQLSFLILLFASMLRK